MHATRPLIVKYSDINTYPPPLGGEFVALRALPAAVPSFASAPLGVFCVNTAERELALTYDDGPHPEHTPRVLDLLAERGAHATFFVLTRQVRKHPGITRRLLDEGHDVALHGEDHRSLLTMSAMSAWSAIRDARHFLEDTISHPVTMYRPPYGQHSFAQAVAIWTLGLRLVLWSSDAVDWLHDEENRIAARALDGAFPGAILLLHDDRGDPETIQPGEALPSFDRTDVLRRILDGLDERDLRSTAASALLSRHQHVRSRSLSMMRPLQ